MGINRPRSRGDRDEPFGGRGASWRGAFVGGDLLEIVMHWPDMLRVAGSLVTNRVRAFDLLRMLARDGYPTPLGQALAEYGRIPKTLHLLAMVDPVDETYRRTVTRQLNIG